MHDFFVSRRGAAGQIAQEVAAVLRSAGFRVKLQDTDIAPSDNFVARMHEMLEQCRHFIAILTHDYASSRYTRDEWTSAWAISRQSSGERRFVVLRAENVEPTGLFAPINYVDLVGVTDPEQRRQIILRAANGEAGAQGNGGAAYFGNGHKVFRGVPPSNPHFIGRDDLLAQLHDGFSASSPHLPTAVALQGLGGIGKSSLAAEYARRHSGAYSGVWWASAENRTVLIGSLAELAHTLDSRLSSTFVPQIATPTDLETLAKAGLAHFSHSNKGWLLVYDNVENPDAIRDLMPSRGAHLLVTTRWPDWGGWATEIAVDVMSQDTAIEFLRRRTGRDDPGAAGLATALGHLPLALDHAGAYLRRSGAPFSRYADRVGELMAKAPVGALYPASVAATFGLAIDRAAEGCPAADKLLAFFAMLAPERIPHDLIDQSILDEGESDLALMELTAVALVRQDPYPDATPAVNVHRLVQAATRARLKQSNNSKPILEMAIRRLSEAFPDNGYGEPKSWPRCEKLLPHALELRKQAQSAKVESPELALLLDGAANALHGRGAYAQAEPLLQEAVEIGRKTVGSDHRDLGQWLNNLANIYMNTGRYKQAEPLYLESILNGSRTLGRNSYRVATRLSNLSNLLMETGRYEEAESLLREAIETVEATLGKQHHMRAARLRNLANLFTRTGRAVQAEALYREAIAVGETTSGRANPNVSTWLSELASVCRDSGRYEEAEPLYREAIGYMESTIGVAHPGVGGVRRELAKLLLATRRETEALTEARLALAIQERAFGPHHDWTAEAASVLMASLSALGRTQEAGDVAARYGLAAKTHSEPPSDREPTLTIPPQMN